VIVKVRLSFDSRSSVGHDGFGEALDMASRFPECEIMRLDVGLGAPHLLEDNVSAQQGLQSS
jgi:hypothetical protein